MLQDKFTINHLKIPSFWFEGKGRNKSMYEKMGGFKGFNIYIQLHKYRLNNQDNTYTFITSINELKNQTKDKYVKSGYTTKEIYDLLVLMSKQGLIELKNISRWTTLVDSKTKKIDEHRLLKIVSTNPMPLGEWNEKQWEQNGISKGDDNSYFIYLPLDIFTYIESQGIDERAFAVLAVLKKWTQKGKKYNHRHRYCYRGLDTIADDLKLHRSVVSSIIKQLNDIKVVASHKRKNSYGKYSYFHFVLDSMELDDVKKFEILHKEVIENTILSEKLEEELRSIEDDTEENVKEMKMKKQKEIEEQFKNTSIDDLF